MNKYEYSELRAAAIAQNANENDINDLGNWFALYGGAFWNGEYYDVDDGRRLFPVFDEIRPGEFYTIGYEFK